MTSYYKSTKIALQPGSTDFTHFNLCTKLNLYTPAYLPCGKISWGVNSEHADTPQYLPIQRVFLWVPHCFESGASVQNESYVRISNIL